MLLGSSNNTQQFRVYFSAADTSIGTAVIRISYASSKGDQQSWTTVAVVVSISCGVFVIIMFFLIWCRNNKESEIVDLTTDPEYISIASAHISKEISGTNHNGTSYVIGSLDKKEKQLIVGINDGSGIERQSVYSSRRDHRDHHDRRDRRRHHEHRHGHKHRHKKRSLRDNHKRKRRRSVRQYETNELHPNYIQIHRADCYEEEDSQNCKFLNINHINVENMNIHSSLNSNIVK